MTLIAVALLPLLVTMSGGHGGDKYSLVVDGVDDQLDCTLNGAPVAHFSYGQSGVVALPARKGPNALVCTPKDMGRAAGHACWAYKYRVFKNWDEIDKIYSTCCTPNCPDQPSPVRIDFEAN